MKLFSNLSTIPTVLILLLSHQVSYGAERYEFDPIFLNTTENNLNMEFFNNDETPEGVYLIDVFINSVYKGAISVNFKKSDADGNIAVPCINNNTLISFGVKENLLHSNGETCFKTNNNKWGSTYNKNQQELYLNIPETNLNRSVDGIAPKIMWDDGITAAFINYSANTYAIKRNSIDYTQKYTYLNLDSGFNLGAWRLRNRAAYTHDSLESKKWQTLSSYLERSLNEIDSSLTIGDFSVSSILFDNYNLRGVGIKRDETMIPGRLRYNHPLIKGFAKTQAVVEVEYNNSVIYSRNVDAGVFEIDDLPYTGGNGVYKLIINESDGTKNIMLFPFTQPPYSLRKGYYDFNMNFGAFRDGVSKNTDHEILNGNIGYGLDNAVTIYSGFQFSSIYEAYAAGSSLNLGSFGVFSLDGVYSYAKNTNNKDIKKGSTISLKYEKGFHETGTDFYYANSSYNNHFRTLNEVYRNNKANDNFTYRKSLTSIGVFQSLDEYGGVRLSFNNERYWDENEYQYIDVSYLGTVKGMALSLGYNEYIRKNNNSDKVFAFSVKVPFKIKENNTVNTRYKYNISNSNGGTHALGFSGTSSNGTLIWSIDQKKSNSTYYGTSGNVSFRNRYGSVGLGVATERGSSSYNANMEGSVLVSKYGVTFGQQINQATALILAQGSSGLNVTGRSGIKTNSQGYAIVSGLQPYRENIVSIDPLNTPEDIEVLQTDINVVPTRGAIVEGRINTSKGRKAFIRLIKKDNKNVPFGSVVSLKGHNSMAGIVGDNGEVFLTGLPESGMLHVKWGRNDENSCSVIYDSVSKNNTKTLMCE
ncbi:TPA: fimbrial biogenesis outer membrane usher protein [Escherichia coli]|nr:fimbrial biogenesis outer membrane usher protein [Escherichia coli]